MSERKALRILAIGAHPDDIDIACAGTLARCLQRGDHVSLAIVCDGEMGGSDLSPEELVATRRKEAQDAAKVLGAEVVHLGIADGTFERTEANKKLLVEVIRQAQPDLVITHYHSDYGGDHNNTLELTVDASIYATINSVHAKYPAMDKIPLLCMMEPLAGYGFQPEVYVDITETLETKIAMLNCHQSQLEWMSRYDGMDMREYVKVMAQFRGYQCGTKMAEGFIFHKSFAHVPVGAILP